ncbi:hypothetical protein HS088_TW03G01160 [Tripterygium wilfordii]|uniref:DUF3741 domain-containing protein n=1 Tax=Tripterygium wilfordii TaxID=458696 RepID=A0A7J7DWQ5_TRIWF|nr:uncharacterized protein LOC119987806 [Tripterygium wilfordii]KAF5750820.1 hypothetical protein HS088_TW03G01160 [Tripterygium wilfordii]
MSASHNADSGCFSAILRRILCAGSLQTHPSDQIAKSNTFDFDHEKKDLKRDAEVQAPGTKRVNTPALAPGVVARLMGLDSLPDTKWIPRERVPDSVTRSRSVNFMDYFSELDLGKSKHRRVRTSVSFREVPTSLHGVQQDQDFLVLYLGNVDKAEEVGSKLKKCEEGLRRERQRDEERRKSMENLAGRVIMKKKKKENKVNNSKISALKNEPRRPVVSHKQFSKADGIEKENNCKKLSGKTPYKAKSPVNAIKPKDKYAGSKNMTKRKKKENEEVNSEVDQECHSDCSSSASVLDHKFLSALDEYLQSEMKPVDSIPKTKMPPTRENYDSLSPHPTQVLNTHKLGLRAKYGAELTSELCRWTKEDIEESNWTAKNGFAFEGFEDICKELVQTILDQLVHHVVCELV